MSFGIWKDIGPYFFYLGYYSLTNNFNPIAKVASILHLKLGGSCRPSYFPISTFQKTLSISMIDLLQVADFLYGKI
jgi:hypothetical protein